MSCRMTYPRHVLQRVSDRKVRKLAIDDSDSIMSDNDFNFLTTPDSRVEIVEDSHPSVKGHFDLFGELIPQTKSVSEPVPKTKYVKRTPVSKKKKKPAKELVMASPIQRPQRKFIPTPRMIKLMKDAQSELYSLMGLNQSSSDVSIVSNDSLNVSGVQSLLDSPKSKEKRKSDTNSANNENSKNSPIFEGVVAFVDYKIDSDRSGVCIIQQLLEMGAKVEKTFNLKVTHVVFRDGYRKTYTKAVERNIPLVSAKWLEDSKLANKILDPIDYPPVDIEKYSTRRLTFNIPKNHHYKCLRPSNYKRDELLKSKCDSLMKRINNFQIDCFSENEETSNIIETPDKTESLIEPEEHYQTNDIISLLSKQLHNILNTDDSPILDEEINNLYVPMSIKVIRKYLTPQGRENKSSTELDSELLKIEDRLKLNSQARQRFRKLLFPLDKELCNMSIVSDFPTPSPEKLRISAPARLICIKKKKKVIDTETLPNHKNLNHNEKSPQEKKNMSNLLKWRIPTDLRPKKVKKIDVKNKKNLEKTLTQETIPNMFSRNSSMIFQTPEASTASPIESQSIACTGFTKSEVDLIKSSIQNLGTFIFHSKVESSTTFVVTKSQPNRTLNMVFAMAYGCYIISEKWIHESREVGRWLPHQQYLIQNLSERVKEFQTRRQTFGALLTFHIFDDAGTIYIADTCEPSAKELKRLVRSCGGQCISIETMADVVVGYTPRMINNINEKWILDCVSQGILLNKHQYTLVNKKT